MDVGCAAQRLCRGPQTERACCDERHLSVDIVFVGLIFGLAALSWGLIVLCDGLKE